MKAHKKKAAVPERSNKRNLRKNLAMKRKPRKKRCTPRTRPTTIYLIRHAESITNTSGILQGQTIDEKLSGRGMEQAKRLKRWANRESIAAVYCSPLSRAVQTARIAFEGMKITELEELKEQNLGALSGKTLDEVFEMLVGLGLVKPEESYKRRETRHLLPYSKRFGGESESEVFERGLRAIKSAADKHRGRKVAMIAHARFNKVVLCGLQGFDFNGDEYGRIRQANTGINVIEVDGDKIRVIGMNLTAHLEPEDKNEAVRF
jgi:broad specificity phosphatase PhoE